MRPCRCKLLGHQPPPSTSDKTRPGDICSHPGYTYSEDVLRRAFVRLSGQSRRKITINSRRRLRRHRVYRRKSRSASSRRGFVERKILLDAFIVRAARGKMYAVQFISRKAELRRPRGARCLLTPGIIYR